MPGWITQKCLGCKRLGDPMREDFTVGDCDDCDEPVCSKCCAVEDQDIHGVTQWCVDCAHQHGLIEGDAA